MKSEISTKLVRLDLKTILDNYTKKEFWNKQWTIYKHNDFKICARLDSIQISTKRIYLDLFSEGRIRYGRKFIEKRFFEYSSMIDIPYDHPEFGEKLFNKLIEDHCLTIIDEIESVAIKQTSEMYSAKKSMSDFEQKVVEVADSRLDELGITDDDVRTAYENKCVDNAEIPDFIAEIYTNMRYKIIPNEYLYLASWFDNKEKYDELCKVCNKVRKSIRIKIWLLEKKINSDEFAESLKDNLADI